MMPARLSSLEQALAGFRETGVPLIAKVGDGSLQGAGFSDDLGLYLVVPPVAHGLGLPVETVTRALLGGVTVLSLVLAATGALLLLRASSHRVAALLSLLWYARFMVLSLGGWNGDLYLFYSATLLATVPLFLWLARRSHFGLVVGGAAWVGAVAGASHLMRAHSGWPVLLLALVIIAGTAHRRSRKALAASVLIGVAAVPLLWQQVAVQQRDAFLERQGRTEAPNRIGHPLWHTVYIGLGFLPNPYGITYRDEAAIERVRQADPGADYLSTRYERVLRDAVMQIAADAPGFIVRTVLAKAVRIFYLMGNLHHVLLLGVGVCWWLLWRCRWPLRARPQGLALGLLAAGGMYGVFGLLAVPRSDYVNGVFACLLLYVLLLLTRLEGVRVPGSGGATGTTPVPEP